MEILSEIQTQLLSYEYKWGVKPNIIEIGIEWFKEIQNQYEVLNSSIEDINENYIYGVRTIINYNNPESLYVGYLESTVQPKI